MRNENEINTGFEWLDLGQGEPYARWRRDKLASAVRARQFEPVEIADLAHPTPAETAEIIRRCEETNFAFYNSPPSEGDSSSIPEALGKFATAFGLQIAEKHRSAGTLGVVALQPSSEAGKRGYIPYSTRPLNWHTDGYYNAPGDRISAFVLHCVRPASSGGTNQILDPEIVYIRLRDENPEYVRALLHPQAMSIPADHAANGSVRPVSAGPVFYADKGTGRLQMRYTARSRSVNWRDDPLTQEAKAFLQDILERGDPLAMQIRLEAGQGILNNNILHNRSGFEIGDAADVSRLIYRIRFHNRIKRSSPWQN